MILQFNIEDKYGYKEKISPEEIVSFTKKNGFKKLVVFARDGWGRAFYKSKIYPLHPSVDQDFIEKLKQLCEVNGIKLVLMVAHTSNKYLCEKYPEIKQINKDGKPICLDTKIIEEIEWPLACLNSKFKEIILKEIDEAKKYTNALMLDSFRYQPEEYRQCFCENCKKEYKKQFGKDLKPSSEINEEYFNKMFWRYKVVIERLKEIKQKNIELIYNSHPAGWNWRNNTIIELGSEYIDVVFAEASETDFMPLGFLSLITKLNKDLSKKEVWTSRNLFHLFNTSKYPGIDQVSLNAFEILFSGGIPLFTIFYSTFKADGNKIDLKELNTHLEIAYSELSKAQPYKEIGIVFSNTTRDYMGYKDVKLYLNDIRGFFYSLYYNNYQINFIGEKNLSEIKNYDIVILPSFACITEKQAEIIKKHCDKTRIIATYNTSLFDEYRMRENFLLSEEFGCSFKTISKKTFYLDTLYPQGDLIIVEPNSNKYVLKNIYNSKYSNGYEYVLGMSSPPKDENIISYITGNRIIYIPFQLGSYLYKYGYCEYEKILFELIQKEPIVKCNQNIRIFVFKKNNSLFLGVINYNINQRINVSHLEASFLEDDLFSIYPVKRITPINAKIEINGIYSDAKSLLFNKKINITHKNNKTIIEFPLDKYELILLN